MFLPKSKVFAILMIVAGSLILVFQPTEGATIFGDLLKRTNRGEVRLTLYTGSSINSSIKTSYADEDVDYILTDIDYDKPTVLYIHGYREKSSDESVMTVADAYLKRGDHNFILLDWSERANGLYLVTVSVVKEVARYIAELLDRFDAEGFPSETLHIVGHSLGGQMAGFIGKYTNFEVTRISALDPAFPGFYQFNAEHIDSSSAKFVDVIHTDGGIYGASSPTGTVDCYANGGSRPQPGCPRLAFPQSPEDFCAHWRSWRFWAESLSNESAFLALKCNSYSSFQSGKCRGEKTAHCGFKMPNTARGKYYFTTNSKSPFGKGSNGIHSN